MPPGRDAFPNRPGKSIAGRARSYNAWRQGNRVPAYREKTAMSEVIDAEMSALGESLKRNWHARNRINDRLWKQMALTLPTKAGVRTMKAEDARKFVEAVLWVAHTGARWSDIPPEYGLPHSLYIRFTRWADAGSWRPILEALAELPETRQKLAALVEDNRHGRQRKALARQMLGRK